MFIFFFFLFLNVSKICALHLATSVWIKVINKQTWTHNRTIMLQNSLSLSHHLSRTCIFFCVHGTFLQARQTIAVSTAYLLLYDISDILPAVWNVTVVVRGQMLRSARQGQEAHSRQGLTDSLMVSVSRPAKLLNHEGQTCGVWGIQHTYCSYMCTHTVAH